MQTHEYKLINVSIAGLTTHKGICGALDLLASKVTIMMEQGWKCEGGVAVSNDVGLIIQAMSRVTTTSPLLLERT